MNPTTPNVSCASGFSLIYTNGVWACSNGQQTETPTYIANITDYLSSATIENMFKCPFSLAAILGGLVLVIAAPGVLKLVGIGLSTVVAYELQVVCALS